MKTANRILHSVFRQIERVVVWILPDRQANRFQTSTPIWDRYYRDAEAGIHEQWAGTIWPLIKDFDFDVVLELAPGGGRNTELLCDASNRIYAVDFSAKAIERCRERLGDSFKGCEILYHRNNGRDLRMIQDESISAIYCWDSAVHFSEGIITGYVAEFSRILKEGGKGFVHHSNLGKTASNNIKKNPHWRSNISKELFGQICINNGLVIESQTDIDWGSIVDCATVFSKPA